MKENLISVIVPAYNCESWLPGCLDSLLAQTYPYLEIIVVNDGSRDATAEILDRYAGEYPQIRAIHQENGGVTSARLRGAAESRGSWIGFADADDMAAPELYERLLENALQCDADISHCGFQVVNPDGSVQLLHGTAIKKQQDRQTGLRDLLEEKLVEPSLCSKLFRRELFAGLRQKMDPSIKNNEDMLMNYFLFAQARQSVFEDVCLYHYLIHPGSASRRKLNRNLIYDPIRVRQMILDHCEPEIRDDARRALARMCLVSYRQVIMESTGEYNRDRRELQTLIRQQLPYVKLLPLRNGLLVRLISVAPWAFDFAYRSFARLTGRE